MASDETVLTDILLPIWDAPVLIYIGEIALSEYVSVCSAAADERSPKERPYVIVETCEEIGVRVEMWNLNNGKRIWPEDPDV